MRSGSSKPAHGGDGGVGTGFGRPLGGGRPEARFDHLAALPDRADRAAAVVAAMESIEADYDRLRGVLPKSEYQALDNEVLGELLRKLNPDELKRVSGDVFGRIYEYFLTRFADQKAHDGEFFMPVSLVSLIAHVLDPDRGTVLDPACGSGGMFVQSARTVEEHGGSPTERLTFRGVEKNDTTIRLARMNLAVHGLEGDIRQAITYYHDPHELLGRADYVMANPPFNVDKIDAGKVRTDPRLPFGLPGVNRKQKVGNGNYVWISYFHSYLNETGRAGFVMSSQASSAGGAEVWRRLVETGDVEVMIAVRSNFFYTRTVPCEFWFMNRAKPDTRRGKVLMLDARHVCRKVTRKIYDFSPEQQQNLLAVVWLYRGQTARFLDLVARAADAHTLMQAIARANRVAEGKNNGLIVDYCGILRHLRRALATFAGTRAGGGRREIDPTRPDHALLAEPAAAIGLVRRFLDGGGAPLDDVIGKQGSHATPPSWPARRRRTRTTRPASVSRCCAARSSGSSRRASSAASPPTGQTATPSTSSTGACSATAGRLTSATSSARCTRWWTRPSTCGRVRPPRRGRRTTSARSTSTGSSGSSSAAPPGRPRCRRSGTR